MLLVRTFLAASLCICLLAGCTRHALVQVSPNGYLASREAYDGPFALDHSGLEKDLAAEADAFARERGKSAVRVAGDRHSSGMWRNFVAYEYLFRLEDPKVRR